MYKGKGLGNEYVILNTGKNLTGTEMRCGVQRIELLHSWRKQIFWIEQCDVSDMTYFFITNELGGGGIIMTKRFVISIYVCTMENCLRLK